MIIEDIQKEKEKEAGKILAEIEENIDLPINYCFRRDEDKVYIRKKYWFLFSYEFAEISKCNGDEFLITFDKGCEKEKEELMGCLKNSKLRFKIRAGGYY